MFTPTEVQALIPSLEAIFGRLVLLSEDVEQAKQALDEAKQKRTTDRTLEELQTETAALEARTAHLRVKLDQARALVSRVEAMGGEVKDLRRGLVDFPWKRNGKVVLICWQFGEKQIRHWHTVEEGFAGRKPLDHPAPEPRSWLN
jgi:hypothetical protein